jgi:hypothetical protein
MTFLVCLSPFILFIAEHLIGKYRNNDQAKLNVVFSSILVLFYGVLIQGQYKNSLSLGQIIFHIDQIKLLAMTFIVLLGVAADFFSLRRIEGKLLFFGLFGLVIFSNNLITIIQMSLVSTIIVFLFNSYKGRELPGHISYVLDKPRSFVILFFLDIILMLSAIIFGTNLFINGPILHFMLIISLLRPLVSLFERRDLSESYSAIGSLFIILPTMALFSLVGHDSLNINILGAFILLLWPLVALRGFFIPNVEGSKSFYYSLIHLFSLVLSIVVGLDAGILFYVFCSFVIIFVMNFSQRIHTGIFNLIDAKKFKVSVVMTVLGLLILSFAPITPFHFFLFGFVVEFFQGLNPIFILSCFFFLSSLVGLFTCDYLYKTSKCPHKSETFTSREIILLLSLFSFIGFSWWKYNTLFSKENTFILYIFWVVFSATLALYVDLVKRFSFPALVDIVKKVDKIPGRLIEASVIQVKAMTFLPGQIVSLFELVPKYIGTLILSIQSLIGPSWPQKVLSRTIFLMVVLLSLLICMR